MRLKGGTGCHRAEKGFRVACESTSVHVWQFCTCGSRTEKVAAKCHVRPNTACDVLDSRQLPFVLGPLPSVCSTCIRQWCIATAQSNKAPNDADVQTYCLQCACASSECCAASSAHCTARHGSTSSETRQHISHCCKNALQLCGPFCYGSRDCPANAHIETAHTCKSGTRCLNE